MKRKAKPRKLPVLKTVKDVFGEPDEIKEVYDPDGGWMIEYTYKAASK